MVATPGRIRHSELHQPDGEAALGEMDTDARDGADRPLETGLRALTAVRDCPRVEQQSGPALPGLLLAAHHELAPPSGRPPVHPVQRVAVSVLAGRDVV